MSALKKKYKKKTINGIKYVQSNEDMQWYPRYLDDWKVLNKMDKPYKLKIQSEYPAEFKTYKDKGNRRSRYMNIPNLRRANASIRFEAPRSEIAAEYQRCRDDIVYFAENYCSIVHIDLGNIKMVPRPYQKEMLEVADRSRFSIFLLPRQLGKCEHHSTVINIRNRHTGVIENITVGKFHEMIKTCKYCNTNFETKSTKATCCGSDDCTLERSNEYKIKDRERALKKSHEKYNENNSNEWVECKECGLRAGDLCSHITRMHDISIVDYQKKHNGGAELVSSKVNLEKKSIAIGSGADNVAYQHGGKFSPWSEKSTTHDVSRAKECHRRAIENSVAKPRSNNIEWWINKGYSEEEATRLLSERQSTFSKESCIEKYGFIEGIAKWQERQDKWQNTLKSKSAEEIEEINRKKATQMNYRDLWRANIPIDVAGMFYAIRVSSDKVKIGITTQTLEKRYNLNVTELEHFKIEHDSIMESFRVEQVLKRHFAEHAISKNESIDGFGWTETFNISLDDVINSIESIDIDAKFNEISK